jgi:inner membrane transporter RhtA
LLSSFAVQIGTVMAKSLFETLGAVGAAFLCKAVASVLLLAVWRPRLNQRTWLDYGLLGILGLSIAGMSLSFYGAIDRIPMGVASTLEFTGPLGVAVLGSRRSLDVVWVTLAGAGVFLLAPISGAQLDPMGVVLALVSAGCWAIYILMSGHVGRAFRGGEGLALSIAIATVILMPAGIAQSGTALLMPWVWVVGIGAAVLGTVVPYSMEYAALKRLPPRLFGVLMSIEPAIAALVGFLFLGEQIGLRSLIAVMLVTISAIGATVFGHSDPHA